MINDKRISGICSRALELKAANRLGQIDRGRIRDIMNGGSKAIRALVPGTSVENAPYANYMLSAGERLAQKLGRPPTIRKEPPISSDSERAAKGAEKLARIVTAFDEVAKLPMLLPQIGRWLPGYGFVPLIVRHGTSRDGSPYPIMEMRDPYEAYPAEWGVGQQPRDIAFCRVMSRSTLAEMYPEHKGTLYKQQQRSAGGVLLDNNLGRGGQPSWANQTGGGVELYEYYDRAGCWWVVPECNLLLSHVPNLMTRPQFYVMKRYSFDALGGQFDHIVGLMAAMARMNLLLVIATEDSVFAETNVYGETVQGDNYHKGRDAVNWLSQGTRVEKPGSQIPFQAFQFLSQFERQLRIVGSYPVTDDSLSPNSFVTGRGLEELTASNDLHVREYQTVIADGLVEIDSLRLEWDEIYYPDRAKPMAGIRHGSPFAETYTPTTHIKGDYTTRRVYGAMAGFDEPAKIATGLQLLAAEIIDDETMMENVDGLEHLSKIKERIRTKKDEALMDELLAQMAVNGDQRVLELKIQEMPDGDRKRLYEQVFLQQQEAPPEQASAEMPGFESPEDTFTALSRMGTNASGDPSVAMSTQTVSAA